ncbi:hypothetical protein [Micromonospora sp. CA-244673]|uniref:hypothetical protein n=1 Tax=Micromonospora sp. CA-244673 TaxID=3239958 RepID=UPI003D8CC83B
MPSFGDLFTDLRGEDRTLRVSSTRTAAPWCCRCGAARCAGGSFRMPADDVDRLVALLTAVRAAGDGSDPAGPGTAAVEVATAVADPAVERTGDVSGTARRVPLPPVPAPRVA